MARLREAEEIYKAAAAWRDNCLIRGKSLLWPETDLWTAANLGEFKRLFIDKPDPASDKSFETKFKEQLAPGEADATRLACELLLIYFLFPDSVRRATNVGLIFRVASWKGIALDENLPGFACLDDGIGNPGQTYNTSRPNELTRRLGHRPDRKASESSASSARQGALDGVPAACYNSPEGPFRYW